MLMPRLICLNKYLNDLLFLIKSEFDQARGPNS